MTPITERLAEALRAIIAAEPSRFVDPHSYVMHVDKIAQKAIDDLTAYRRTHPAEGGEERDYVLVPREPTEAMVSAGFDVHPCRTGETKVTDAYKAMLAAAPPPQPVAPERGEAKAVAWRWFLAPDDRDIADDDYFVAHYQYGDRPNPDEVCEPLYLAPQPPPAPTFRDPTIEDLQAARLFIEQYEREHPEADDDELGIAALNAIGAKVEEK